MIFPSSPAPTAASLPPDVPQTSPSSQRPARHQEPRRPALPRARATGPGAVKQDVRDDAVCPNTLESGA